MQWDEIVLTILTVIGGIALLVYLTIFIGIGFGWWK